MKCPWQKEIFEETMEKEITRQPVIRKMVVFGKCCECECPFYKKHDGFGICRRILT